MSFQSYPMKRYIVYDLSDEALCRLMLFDEALYRLYVI